MKFTKAEIATFRENLLIALEWASQQNEQSHNRPPENVLAAIRWCLDFAGIPRDSTKDDAEAGKRFASLLHAASEQAIYEREARFAKTLE